MELSWKESINSKAEWAALAHAPEDSRFARQSVVKVIIELVNPPSHDEVRVYFLQSKKWVFHHIFIREVLRHPTAKNLAQFNSIHYVAEHRTFILGTILHYVDQDVYTFELAPRDTLSGHRIYLCFAELRDRLFFGSKLKFRPLSDTHKMSIQGVHRLPLVDSDTLFKGIKYQPLTEGEAYGKLRILRKNQDEAAFFDSIDPATVLLCEEIPTDLPALAALITSDIQTPLCHVALLCANRQTPNMALVGAASDPSLSILEGQYVKIKVTLRDFTITVVQQAESEKWHQVRRAARQAQTPKLEYCLTIKNLIEFPIVKDLPESSMAPYNGAMGSKAAQTLAMICSKLPHQIPFVDTTNLDFCLAIPFYFYHKHIKSCCKEELKGFLEQERLTGGLSPEEVRAALSTVRFLIEDSPLPPACAKMIESLANLLSAWRRSGLEEKTSGVIFRSSTNVEDIPGFNGAGLYDSIHISWDDAMDPGKLCATVRSVWASTWNYRGFQERSVFGMNQEDVYMGILVQPFFGKAQVHCNGVAVTAHPFRSDFPGYFINAQVAGKAVTDNQGTPEQIIVWRYNKSTEPEKLASSSEVPQGVDLLSNADIVNLSSVLGVMEDLVVDPEKDVYVPGTWKLISKECIDVEFLLLQKMAPSQGRMLVILQCRPFTKHYYHDPE